MTPDAPPAHEVPTAPKPLVSPFPPIMQVAPTAPFGWLARGVGDLRRAPFTSMAYGLVFALMGWTIAFVFRHAYEYTSALSAGFLLLGPFLATGLYDISRRLERGEPVH